LGIDKIFTSFVQNELKFDKITKVQRETIPMFSNNKDVCVKACTGSGKTLAYVLSML